MCLRSEMPVRIDFRTGVRFSSSPPAASCRTQSENTVGAKQKFLCPTVSSSTIAVAHNLRIYSIVNIKVLYPTINLSGTFLFIMNQKIFVLFRFGFARLQDI